MNCKKSFIIIFLLLLGLNTIAQDELQWIDANETYLKVNISEDGVHRLYLADLDSMLLDNIKGDNEFPHLLYHGKEVPLQYGKDSVNGPFLIFYAEKNKGLLDSLVYPASVNRANPYVPLFRETSPYFLYWNDVPNSTWQTSLSNPAPPLTAINKEELLVFNDQYSFNNSIGLLPLVQQSYYENGEGWTGPFLSMDSSYTLKLPLPNWAVSNQPIHLEFQVNGRSRVNHKLNWRIQETLQTDTLRISPFGFIRKEVEVIPNEPMSEITVTFEGIPQNEFDWYSMTYFKWSYQSLPIFDNGISFSTSIEASNAFNDALLIEYNSPWDYREVGGAIKTFSPNQTYKYYSTYNSIADFEVFEPIGFNATANYIIVTDTTLIEGANAFATYRSSEIGGSFKTDILFTKDIYNQFSYGERTPIALRNYAKWLLAKGVTQPYLFLLGRAVSFPDVMKDWEERDLVPTMGYPASDALLTAGLDDRYGNDVQAFATGRLNVTNNNQITTYLSKVKEHESTIGNKNWQKQFLHLSGGRTARELDQLSGMLAGLEPITSNSLWQPEVAAFRKRTLEEIEPIDISQQVNEGVGMISFAGHGNANVLDLNIGYADTPESGLANKGKYPIMYFNGCGVGNVFYRYDPLSTDWLLAKDRGAVAVFANSFWSYLFSSQIFLQNYYESFLQDSTTVSLRIGQIHREINQKMSGLAFNPFVKANIHQVVLQGDPALRFFDMAAPDYFVEESSFFLKSKDENTSLATSNDYQLGYILGNAGRVEQARSLTYTVSLSGENGPMEITGSQELSEMGSQLFLDIPAGIYTTVSIEINPEKEFNETNFGNNFKELVIEDWVEASKATAWPLVNVVDQLGPTLWAKFENKFIPDGDLVVPNAEIDIYLRDENPINLNKESFEIQLTPCASCVEGIFPSSEITLSLVDEYTVKASFKGPSTAGVYELVAIGKDKMGNFSAQKLSKTFEVSNNKSEDTFTIYPNPAEEFAEIKYFLNDFRNPLSSELQILDVKGQLLRSEAVDFSVGSNSHIMDTASLPAGTYELRLIHFRANDSESITKRLVKR